MNGTAHETEVSGCMNNRRLRIIKYVAIAVAVMVLAWGASAIAVYAASSGRVFDSASIDAVPRQRAAVVMGCVRTLPNGLNNLYFSRRIDAAAELYKAGKVDCLIVSGDNHVKGYDEPSDMKESLAKAGVPADRIVCDTPDSARSTRSCGRRRCSGSTRSSSSRSPTTSDARSSRREGSDATPTATRRRT